MKDYVNVSSGINAEEQQSSFQNGTLQEFGGMVTITVQTYLAVPAEMQNCTQEEASDWLNKILTEASDAVGNRLVFDVQVGLTHP